MKIKVAPYAGAWIETSEPCSYYVKDESLPTRERGLKRLVIVGGVSPAKSLPTRERGLKRCYAHNVRALS